MAAKARASAGRKKQNFVGVNTGTSQCHSGALYIGRGVDALEGAQLREMWKRRAQCHLGADCSEAELYGFIHKQKRDHPSEYKHLCPGFEGNRERSEKLWEWHQNRWLPAVFRARLDQTRRNMVTGIGAWTVGGVYSAAAARPLLYEHWHYPSARRPGTPHHRPVPLPLSIQGRVPLPLSTKGFQECIFCIRQDFPTQTPHPSRGRRAAQGRSGMHSSASSTCCATSSSAQGGRRG